MSDSNKRDELSQVQNLILDIFKQIHDFCNQKDIEYFMLGGTLLGAVRHEGFIPWDDDIDIGIPRCQYERFLNEISNCLPNHLELKTYKNSCNHHYYFSRVVDKRYSLKRLGSQEERNEEVWVDIFPLDGMPNNLVIRKFHQFRLLYTRMLYHISCFEKVNLKRPNRPLSERIVINFIKTTNIGKNIDTRKKLDQIDKLLKKYSLESSKYIINFMGQYKFKEMFPKLYYGTGNFYNFENLKLRGPVHYDKVLTQMYGDYMIPPRESERNTHATELNQ